LYFFGVPLHSLVSWSETKIYHNGTIMMEGAVYKPRWPLIVLYLTGALGLCLLLIPSKKRIPPIIRPTSKS
jgi:hypothetical protein